MFDLSKDRMESIETIKKITDYDDYNVYSIEIKYDYNIDNVTPVIEGNPDSQQLMELAFADALPGVDVEFEAPDYGCSAFTMPNDEKFLFGRNYDFAFDSSAMLVRCTPKKGYKSIGFAALSHIYDNDPEISMKTKASCLIAPYICLDGINEKGLGIAVLTETSEPTVQKTGKPVLLTTVLIRLILDNASTTEDAVELIRQYDVFASSGRDYHFYITDKTGDGRVVEFDPEKEERPMVVTKFKAATNFYGMHIDKVKPNRINGIYGKGKERYDSIMDIIDNGGNGMADTWKALKASAQDPNPEDITSNTQWSIAYDLDKLECEMTLRRHWDDILKFKLDE